MNDEIPPMSAEDIARLEAFANMDKVVGGFDPDSDITITPGELTKEALAKAEAELAASTPKPPPAAPPPAPVVAAVRRALPVAFDREAEEEASGLATEREVLGGMMFRDGAWKDVHPILVAFDLESFGHQEIFQAIMDLAHRGKAHDPVSVSAHLLNLGRLEAVGGLAYLSRITRNIATGANVAAHAQIVRERSKLRMVKMLGSSLQEQAQSGGFSAAQILESAQPQLKALTADITLAPFRNTQTIAGIVAKDIKPREYLMGYERAFGELAVTIGPPGVGKSTCELAELVSIATGQSLFFLEPKCTPVPVLYMSGEDAQRDVAGRTYALADAYGIPYAELDKVHHFCLPDVGPEEAAHYRLAWLEGETPVLNHAMFEWLAEHPARVIAFSPLSSWHTLPENSNDCMPWLIRHLLSLARRTGKHITFDVHIGKVHMIEPEAHCGKLDAWRGASGQGGAVRGASTFARISSETASELGIPDGERHFYRRKDQAKASYAPDDAGMRLFKFESQSIANGESFGILREVSPITLRSGAAQDELRRKRTQERAVHDAVLAMMQTRDKWPCSAAAMWLVRNYPGLFVSGSSNTSKGKPMSGDGLRKKLPELIDGMEVSWQDPATQVRKVSCSSTDGVTWSEMP